MCKCDTHTAVETVFTAGEPVSVNLLEWFVRRRYRTIRPTFTAEPSTLTNSTGTHYLLQSALHQVYCGTQERAGELHQKRETGSLYPPIELLVITHSVSGTVTAPDVFIPQETFSKLQLITNCDWFARGLFKSVSGTEALQKSRIEQTMVTEAIQGRVTLAREVKIKWRTSSRGHREGHDGDNEKFWSVDQTQFSRVLAQMFLRNTHSHQGAGYNVLRHLEESLRGNRDTGYLNCFLSNSRFYVSHHTSSPRYP